MIVVVGEFRIPLKRRSEAKAAMEKIILASRAEPGCEAYAYAEDVSEPGLFRVSEVWQSRAALTAHFAMPHMKNWQRERGEFGMSGRQVTAFEVGKAEVL